MSNPYPQHNGMTFYAGVGGTKQSSGNCYGDGTVYRGECSKDSATPTIYNPWEAAYQAVCDERDAIAKGADKAYELLRRQDELLRQAISALEPWADVKPRDWKTDREKLWRLHDDIRNHLEAK